MWSTVSASPPQYAHEWPSRSRMAARSLFQAAPREEFLLIAFVQVAECHLVCGVYVARLDVPSANTLTTYFSSDVGGCYFVS